MSAATELSSREKIFLVIAAIFISSLVIANFFSVSKFLNFNTELLGINFNLIIPIGALPYPITFLCTDLISEFYGKRRANFVVWLGLIVSCWQFLLLWLTGAWQPTPEIDSYLTLTDSKSQEWAFYKIRTLAMGAIISSMLAYLVSQFLDVRLYHFWKNLTKNKHLWLRNNGSTLVSQFVDTTIVVFLTYYFTDSLPLDITEKNIFSQLLTLIFSLYIFKALCAIADTVPLYIVVKLLKQQGIFPTQQ